MTDEVVWQLALDEHLQLSGFVEYDIHHNFWSNSRTMAKTVWYIFDDARHTHSGSLNIGQSVAIMHRLLDMTLRTMVLLRMKDYQLDFKMRSLPMTKHDQVVFTNYISRVNDSEDPHEACDLALRLLNMCAEIENLGAMAICLFMCLYILYDNEGQLFADYLAKINSDLMQIRETFAKNSIRIRNRSNYALKTIEKRPYSYRIVCKASGIGIPAKQLSFVHDISIWCRKVLLSHLRTG